MKRPRLALAGCASLVWGLAGASYSGSGSGSDGYSSGTGEVVSGRDTSGDSCAYYALEPGESCRQPRSCYDCLNVELPSEDEGCLLSQFGACESMTFYDATLDFRAEGSMADSGSPTDFTGGWFHQFPAVNTTYCEASDPACVECDAIARNMSADSNFIAQTTKFCVGSSGCVCILSCEATVFAARAIAQCEASSSSGSASSPAPVEAYMDTGSSSSRSSSSSSSAGLTRENHGVVVLWLTVVVVAFVIALAVGFYVRYVRQPRGRRTPRHTLSSAAQLQLAGWRALHEELIQQQKTSGSDDSRRIELATISPDAPPR